MAPERASADQADRLNDDVVAEILLRLPSAAVLRSRAVCRAWRRITTSPAFLAAHAHPLELILRAQGYGALYTVPLATRDETRRRHLDLRWCGAGLGFLVGTCGGLLLFERGSGRDHIVCNPATRQWIVLPRTSSDWIRACGVYTHSPSGEHRLLYLADDDDDRQPGTRRTASHRVLTLGAADDEARRIGPPDAAIEFYTQLAGPYINHRGNLHWLRHPWVFDTDKILAFDTVSETFRRIPRLPLASNDDNDLYLGEAHGNLALTAIVGCSMDLWVLEDYHGSDSSSWTHRLRVNLPPSMLQARWAMMNADVLGQNVILLENYYVLALYHLTEKKVLKEIKLRADDDSEGDDTHWTSLVFRESLERHAFFDLQAPVSPDNLSA